ncbi:MAG: protein translocase subunit SecF [Nanoarchaeota archaeon]|nr:protein translocase subunit SecF [Nanoarchaeota archaeon]
MAKAHKKKRLESRFGKKEKPMAKISLPTNQEPLKVEKKASKNFLETHYKHLLIIPFLMLLTAFVILGAHYAQTGDLINRGISLKGGTAITLTPAEADLTQIDTSALEAAIREAHPNIDVTVRTQKNLQDITAIEIETDISDQDQLTGLKETLAATIPDLTVEEAGKNAQTSGSALGDAFFRQIIQALIVAFILMGIVVFIQFRVPIPSLAVILAAFSDIVVTLAVVDLLGIKLGTAGIAAFLMLIGYSVDTDILLSTRVLKNTEGSLSQRIMSAMKTGLTMNITTLAAVTIALIFTQSDTIRQIMTILFIGLLVDMINTWIQNAGILRWYVEKKELN